MSRPSLALIHGWGLGRQAWAPVIPALSAHLDIHLVDLPGYASAPPDPACFADAARRIACRLPAGSLLCGWSLGALLALEIARQQAHPQAEQPPTHFSGLILVGATPCFTQRDDWPHAQTPQLLERFTQAVADAPAETLRHFIALLNQGDAQARAHTRSQQRALSAMPAPDPGSLQQGLDWLGNVDLRAAVTAITMPTLLIHGDRDPLMPLPAARWLSAALPNARLACIEGAAHAPFLSAPERFAELVIEHCHVCRITPHTPTSER